MTTTTYRHHPYAQDRPAPDRPKWHSVPPTHGHATATLSTRREGLPPSPPRSRRDGSEKSESSIRGVGVNGNGAVGLGVVLGSSGGGKWWDDELVRWPSFRTRDLSMSPTI